MSQAHKPTTEKDFEEAIETWLTQHGGYTSAPASQFDRQLALDPVTLLAYIQASQPTAYAQLQKLHGAQTDSKIVHRIAQECDKRGLLDVLRKGISDSGQSLFLATFRPATRLNPATEQLYQQNRLTVMRQVRFDLASQKSLDMLLSVNGLPIATVELKNPLTGQRTAEAIRQYLKDRIPTPKTPLLTFKSRALVHFAVDPDEVSLTTHLKGPATFFLPFNTGNHGGKGNPSDHTYQTGYKTGYLWEEVWQKESWLDILHRFIHLQKEESPNPSGGKPLVTERLIFPRYHQLSATRHLLAASRANGPGTNYLIQHSAGSGKTNTISWTAHQLATLHNDADQPVFNSVIVVSDRRNLDRQLQDNIFEIEHKSGVVAKIDDTKHAADLAAELNQGTKIIITTLQKFSFLLDNVKSLAHRRFAIIVDEAHSSQGSKHSANLIQTLGATTHEGQLAASETAESSEATPPDMEDMILAEAKRRGPQPNLSFFAFTATPKKKTLEMFGVPSPGGNPLPFHLYSMRQAIEEHFIFDVLHYYTTYQTYYKLSKAIADDPTVDEKKAKKAIARFVSLHPHNLAQKTEIMVEHFHQFTRHKINGRAKAMVVTRSRLHAVRYKQAFDKYIQDKGYNHIRTLVAFSGTVTDPDDKSITYSEASLNGFGEKELPSQFDSPNYHILIVAEKYQTGFDQPLLHTMFVDKKLADLKAVQTLSRLNRTTNGKVDTFVLDFANEAEAIKEAFQPYFERTEIDEPTDPNILYSLETEIHAAQIVRPEEINAFAVVYFKPQAAQTKLDHGQFNHFLDPAVERYKQAYRDTSQHFSVDTYTAEGEAFKHTLQQFVRLYAFLSQIIAWQDARLEKLYAYGRYLLTKLPYRTHGGLLDLDDEVVLASYRNEKRFEGGIGLAVGEIKPVYGVGDGAKGSTAPEKKTPLSAIIEDLNQRFGTNWTSEDALLFEQITGDMMGDEALATQARVNSKAQFRQVFEKAVTTAFVGRQGRNEKIVNEFMSNEKLRTHLISALLDEVYARVRSVAA